MNNQMSPQEEEAARQLVQDIHTALSQGAQPHLVVQELVQSGNAQHDAQNLVNNVSQQVQRGGGGGYEGGGGGIPGWVIWIGLLCW